MIVLAVSVNTYLAYNYSKNQLELSISNELLAVAKSTALFIDADLQEEIVRIDDDLVEGIDAFDLLKSKLEEVKITNNLNQSSNGSPIYILRKTDDFDSTNNLEFVVMTDKNSEGEYYIGNLFPAEQHHIQALNGEAVATSIYHDSEGTWISAVAPIRYADERVAGVVQVDRNINYFQEQAFSVAKELAVGSIIVIIIAAIVSYLFSKLLTNPLNQITDVASNFGSDLYEKKIDIKSKDEIGVLADAFNKMIIRLNQDKKIKLAQQIKLENLTKELEIKVKDRTNNLLLANKELEKILHELKTSQANLIQSEKMASLGTLSAGVAHEINNPMAFIASNLSTLDRYVSGILKIMSIIPRFNDDEYKNDKKRASLIDEISSTYISENISEITEDISDLIEESIDGAERIKEIVSNLKGFSRVDSEEMQLININDCIGTTLKIANNETKNACNVNCDLADLPSIQCFPGKLNQVLLNIIVNAAQSMDGYGEINIFTYCDDMYVYVDIKDNGCGIPKENLDKLFEAFFTTKPVGQGTGLGLYISFGIMEEHKGKININSEVGEGTTFQLMLPIQQSDQVINKDAA